MIGGLYFFPATIGNFNKISKIWFNLQTNTDIEHEKERVALLLFLTEVSHWSHPRPDLSGGARPYPGCPELSFSTTRGVRRVARAGWAATVPSTEHRMLTFFCQNTLSWDKSPLKCYLSYTGWKTLYVSDHRC